MIEAPKNEWMKAMHKMALGKKPQCSCRAGEAIGRARGKRKRIGR
ncbi:hypothetical protein BRPE64_CCDS03430 [Caballeronia insecticola]|uniref:Uncharacterized protein n=1 Tax=Caballeronia insecticola TaxID=758793 RepID=R4X1Z3_9BURK|nr:hypothetical protein BRPE64_CCDS03430 [Caballeronia insecticola]